MFVAFFAHWLFRSPADDVVGVDDTSSVTLSSRVFNLLYRALWLLPPTPLRKPLPLAQDSGLFRLPVEIFRDVRDDLSMSDMVSLASTCRYAYKLALTWNFGGIVVDQQVLAGQYLWFVLKTYGSASYIDKEVHSLAGVLQHVKPVMLGAGGNVSALVNACQKARMDCSQIKDLSLSDHTRNNIKLSVLMPLLTVTAKRLESLDVGPVSKLELGPAEDTAATSLTVFTHLTSFIVRYEPGTEDPSRQSNALPRLLGAAPLKTLKASKMSFENVLLMLHNCGATITDLRLDEWHVDFGKLLPCLKNLMVERISTDATTAALCFPTEMESLHFFVDDASDWHPPDNLSQVVQNSSRRPRMQLIMLTRFQNRHRGLGQPSPELSRAIEPLRIVCARRSIRLCWKNEQSDNLLDIPALVNLPSMLSEPPTPTEVILAFPARSSWSSEELVALGDGRPDRHYLGSIEFSKVRSPSADTTDFYGRLYNNCPTQDWSSPGMPLRDTSRLLLPILAASRPSEELDDCLY